MQQIDVARVRAIWSGHGWAPELVDQAIGTFDIERFAHTYFADRSGRPWEPREYQRPSLRSIVPRKVHQDGRDVGKTSEIEIVVCWAIMMSPVVLIA